MTDNREWHLEKTVSISHIVSTIMLILAALAAWTQVKTDIEGVRSRVEGLEKAAQSREANLNALRVELRTDIQVFRSEMRQDMQLIVREVRSLERKP